MKPYVPLLAGALLLATPAYAQLEGGLPSMLPGLENSPPFTADVVVTSQAMPGPTSYHIEYMPKKVRMETGGEVIIARLDQGMLYVSQGPNQWMEMSLDAAGAAGLDPANFHQQLQKTGEATVDGKLCDVYRSSGGDGISTTSYLYHDFPIRSVVDGPMGHTTVDYRNIQTGAVSSSLFDLPPGAQVMTMQSLLNQVKGMSNLQNMGNLQNLGN